MNRRRFLRRAAQAAALISFPTLAAPRSVLGAAERIRLGFLGVGGRAGSLLDGFASIKDAAVVSIYDIDQRRIPDAVRRTAERQGREPQVAENFREVIDDPGIDGIVVGTPDHWHALPVVLACQAGKDAYVEKPISHNIHEGAVMVEAARKHRRVVQVGIQSRSSPHHREAMDYVRSGRLGKVCVVKAWESSRQRNLGFPADEPVPEGVDYDTWLGPAPERPFNPLRFHGSWRWFFDYGTGDLGNDGVHRLDYALRGLNAARESLELPPVTFPESVSASGGKLFFRDAQEWPDTLYVTYDFPGAVLVYEMRVWTRYPIEGEGEGAAVYGDRGYVVIGNSSWRAYDAAGKPTGDGGRSANDVHDPAHKRDFLDSMRSRKAPSCDIETGYGTTVLCHLGNIAWRLGRTVRFDAPAQSFGGDAEANRFLAREARPRFALPERI